MSQDPWDVTRTEEGLQSVLRKLAECRSAQDEVGIGNGLMALAYLVMWVRSDTVEPPIAGPLELSLEALEAFRRAQNVPGQVRALVRASASLDPESRERMMSEAEHLANGTGDEDLVAMVIAGRARALAMTNSEASSSLHQQALEIYRRTGNRGGQARSLFALSVSSGSAADKRDYALEAATINRELGESAEAARCVALALMNAEELAPLSELEELAQAGLQDCLDAGDRSQEGHFYTKLGLIAAAKGQIDEAQKFRRWASDIENSDGLTPRERWENNVEMTKMMISMAKVQGAHEAVKTFREELKRLRSEKPSS